MDGGGDFALGASGRLQKAFDPFELNVAPRSSEEGNNGLFIIAASRATISNASAEVFKNIPSLKAVEGL